MTFANDGGAAQERRRPAVARPAAGSWSALGAGGEDALDGAVGRDPRPSMRLARRPPRAWRRRACRPGR